MVKVKRELVFVTFLTSGLAVILSFVALGTQYWVSSDVEINISTGRLSSVNYGLFGGIYERWVATTAPQSYELIMTCSFGENACAVLCDSDRSSVLDLLIANGKPSFGCATLRGVLSYEPTRPSTRSDSDRSFINAGLWLCTILFLVLSCAFGVISAVLAMWNTVYNPVEAYLNILGLFVGNCIACTFSLLTLVIWGVLFATTLVNNICVLDTIVEEASSEGRAILHFSYWLNIASMLLYVSSLVILAVRQHLVNKEPDLTIKIDEGNDVGLILY